MVGFLLAVTVCTWAATPRAGGIPEGKNPPEITQLLMGAVGDPDPAASHRLARLVTSRQLVQAFYTGSRTERLVALDVAGCLEDPWTILPYLASLMGARDRQVSSRAAGALLKHLSGGNCGIQELAEVVPGQVVQLMDQLLSLANDVRLDVDLRASALAGIRFLRERGYVFSGDFSELLRDPDRAVRRAALAVVDHPISEDYLSVLASIVFDDQDSRLRGQAAALLCENALVHGVSAPSKDLTTVMKTVIGDAQVPADAIAPLLACLSHFPAPARADLIDLASSHPDKRVGEYWKSL